MATDPLGNLLPGSGTTGGPWTPGYGVLGGPATPATPPTLAGQAAGSAAAAGTSTLSSALPDYMTSMGNIGTNIASETAGQVPQDVISQLQQNGAESNTGTGASSNAAYLRALGLTSLGLETQGQQNLEGIEPSIPGYTTSQNPAFQTTSQQTLTTAEDQASILDSQQQQNTAFQQQQKALQTAQAGLTAGSTAGSPTNSWSGSSAVPGSSPWSAATGSGTDNSVTSVLNSILSQQQNLPSSGSFGPISWNASPSSGDNDDDFD